MLPKTNDGLLEVVGRRFEAVGWSCGGGRSRPPAPASLIASESIRSVRFLTLCISAVKGARKGRGDRHGQWCGAARARGRGQCCGGRERGRGKDRWKGKGGVRKKGHLVVGDGKNSSSCPCAKRITLSTRSPT